MLSYVWRGERNSQIDWCSLDQANDPTASDELGSLTRAFSGLVVDENAFVSILGKWHPEQRQSFRKGSRDFFVEDELQFERWDDRHILQEELITPSSITRLRKMWHFMSMAPDRKVNYNVVHKTIFFI